jgi:hypothetical protein
MVVDFVPIVVFGLVVYTLLNFFKFLLNGDWNQALTLIVGWLVGIAALWLFGATVWGGLVSVGEHTLDDLSFWDKVVAGLAVVSSASFGYDLKRAFDRSDSASTPALLGKLTGKTGSPPVPPQE